MDFGTNWIDKSLERNERLSERGLRLSSTGTGWDSMKATNLLLMLCGLSLFSITVSAKPVQWTLNNVQFNDGATATGWFVYDVDTKEFSAANISTEGGGARQSATYTTSVPAAPSFRRSFFPITIRTRPRERSTRLVCRGFFCSGPRL